jgi:hypothetical protein
VRFEDCVVAEGRLVWLPQDVKKKIPAQSMPIRAGYVRLGDFMSGGFLLENE